MAHFANINQENIVTQVIVIDNSILLDEKGEQKEQKGIEFCKQLYGESTEWIQTSYNSSFRGTFAGIDYIYLKEKDIFIPPQPFESWNFDEIENIWKAPIEKPDNNNIWIWSEDQKKWITVN